MSAFVQRCCSLALSLRSRLAAPPAAARSAAPATAMSKYYAVRVGSQPGIYRSWAECESKVRGVKGAVHKSFATLALAEAFMGGASAGGGGAAAFKAPAGRAASPPRPAKKRGRASSPQRGGARARVGVCSLAGVAQEEGTYVLQFDGGARGNPGPSGAGAVLLAPGGGAALAQACTWLGHATNNEAEYQALISGLRLAARVPAVRRLLVEGDSTLVTRQMTGEWRVEARGLQPLWAAAHAAAAHFEACTFRYIPREENAAADALANEAMDRRASRAWRMGEGARREDVLDLNMPAPATAGGAGRGGAAQAPPHEAAEEEAEALAALFQPRAGGGSEDVLERK